MVLNNITNFVNKVFQPPEAKIITPLKNNQNYNPFGNHFLKAKDDNRDTYGRNKPVLGGFFAGYYNGKPNIVGTRLFVEV